MLNIGLQAPKAQPSALATLWIKARGARRTGPCTGDARHRALNGCLPVHSAGVLTMGRLDGRQRGWSRG